MYSPSEKITALVFYLISTIVLGFIAYATAKRKLKRSFDLVLFIISTVGLIFNTLWIFSVLFPSANLNSLVISLAGILLPIIWLLASLGFMVYGTVAVVKRQTYVKYPVFIVPQKVKGITAVYHGILWIIAGFMMLLVALIIVGFALCDNQSSICFIVDTITNLFSALGGILIFLSTPLKWLGLM